MMHRSIAVPPLRGRDSELAAIGDALASTARGRGGVLLEGPPGIGELRVARLVAGGVTNRDAAEQLFLSQHTVSSHLHSAFGKLAINSRTEPARVARAHDQADGP